MLWGLTCPLFQSAAGQPFSWKPSGQWVSSEATWLPKCWSSPVQALFAMDSFESFWEFGRICNNWVYCSLAEKRRHTRLDVISPGFEEGHLDKRFDNASFCGHCGEHLWCVAADRLLFEGDGTKRWRGIVVRCSSFDCISAISHSCILFLWC